ncbi:MAG TPA: MFS transporter [Solirubrobacteraceae bacterium]|jgi:EmrB/QacA subfamily drug resistance transporter|nr:MFS transporter [Solirubrobacteraceae bacterium]
MSATEIAPQSSRPAASEAQPATLAQQRQAGHQRDPRPARAGARSPLLLVVCLAQFMVILDVSIVNVALPAIHAGLRFSTTGLQWVVNAYTLTFAGFLMLGGRCADLLGRRRVFLAGTALFALSSLACALADSRGLLLGARALQGFGGAVLSPATLAIVTSSFEAGPERNRALGMWAAMGALGASSGVLLGGILTQAFGWPAIFAVNVPLGALVIAYALRVVPRGEAARGTRHFDVAGAVLVTASLVSLTFAIVRTDTLGWGSAGVLVPLVLGAALLAGFLWVEARVAAVPLVSLPALRSGRLAVANLVVTLLYAAFFPVWFFLTLYLQDVLHFDAIEAGLSFLPMTLSIFVASTLAPRLVARAGARAVISVGMLCSTLGLALLVGIAPHGSYLPDVLPGATLSAIGMGLSLVPATIVAMQSLPASQSGMGSGLLNTSRLMGGALGLAVLSTLADARTHARAALGLAHALTDGYDLAFAVGAAITLLGALIAAIALHHRRAPSQAPAAAAAPPAEDRLEDSGDALAA